MAGVARFPGTVAAWAVAALMGMAGCAVGTMDDLSAVPEVDAGSPPAHPDAGKHDAYVAPPPATTTSTPPPPPPPMDDASTPPPDDASVPPPPPVDAAPPPVDAAPPPQDSGSPTTCGTLVAPSVTAHCHSCDAGNCQANGCYGGYWCDTTTNYCHQKPTNCP